jgi:hypothetical protein
MKKFLNTIRIVALAAVLAAGVSYVFAFTEPTVNPPATTPAPIHTGEPVQEKKGGIWSKRVLASPIALFKKNMFLPGNKSALRIGSGNGSTGTQSFTKGSAGAITQDLNTALFNDDTTIPLVIDLQGRAKPTDAIEFKTGLACPIATRFTNDKAAAFEFRKGTGTDRANLIARQVQLTGGNPDTKDVLVGDVNGNARWAKASVVNGVVQFSNDSVSPVIEGQSCVVTPPVEIWVKGKTCIGLSIDDNGNDFYEIPSGYSRDFYEIPSGYSRARVVEKVTHNGEPLLKYYNDSCLVREKVDASVDPTRPFLCHAVPVGEGSGTYQGDVPNETITTSCTDTGGNNNDFYQEFLKE